MAFKSGVLVVATSETRPVLHLHFWRRVAIDEFDYICRLELRVDNARVELDDRYVAVYGEDPDSANYKIHFVSTRNFQIKKLLEVKKKARFHYNQGIFFVIERVGRIQ